MTILALDLGTTTGFAWGTKGAVASGTWSFKPKKYEGAGVRYLRFRQALDLFHKTNPIELVTFEAVRAHAGTDAAHVYGGLMGTLEAWCEEQSPKVPYYGVPVGTIKKYWTGKGNAPKDAMIRVAELMGFAPVDDNEADALALLYFTIEAGGVDGQATKPTKRRITAAPMEPGRHVVR